VASEQVAIVQNKSLNFTVAPLPYRLREYALCSIVGLVVTTTVSYIFSVLPLQIGPLLTQVFTRYFMFTVITIAGVYILRNRKVKELSTVTNKVQAPSADLIKSDNELPEVSGKLVWPELLAYENIEIKTYKIAAAIAKLGYGPASYAFGGGPGVTAFGDSYIGLLAGNKPIVGRDRFLGIFSRRIRRDKIGVFWFNLTSHATDKAAPNQWTIEVFGRSNMPRLQELADEITRVSKVPVKLILTKEYADQETMDSDYG